MSINSIAYELVCVLFTKKEQNALQMSVLVHAMPCCPATVYAVLLWLYLLSAFRKLNTYIHTYNCYDGHEQH